MAKNFVFLAGFASLMIACSSDGGDSSSTERAPATLATEPGSIPTVAHLSDVTSVTADSAPVTTVVPLTSPAGPVNTPSQVLTEPPVVDANLVALDIASGEPRWDFATTSEAGFEVLAANESTVHAARYVFMSPAHELVALDATSGATKWTMPIPLMNESYERDALYADGAFAGGGVIVLDLMDGTSGATAGFDAETGTERWRVVHSTEMFVTANTERFVVIAEPDYGALDPGEHIRVAALDRLTGAELWAIDGVFGAIGAPWGPRVAPTMLFLPQFNDGVPGDEVALDIETGRELWRSPGWLLAASTVGVGSTDLTGGGEMFGSDLTSGTRLWTAPIEIDPVTPPVLDDATAFVRSGSTTTAHDLGTGQERWRVDDLTPLYASADRLFGVDATVRVVSLAATDGTELWRSDQLGASGESVTSVLSNGTLLFVSTSAMRGP
jgi:outer membrane protein assembly factor BamB